MMLDPYSLEVYIRYKESTYLEEASQRRLLRHLPDLEDAARPKWRFRFHFWGGYSESTDQGLSKVKQQSSARWAH